ncbi:hypothetical protein RRG08_041018 [Elysia crispata]|uniref:Uncharacterized protein n=1 Tax=Elysia crispata TaxID=231223 RepID=A0AAE1EF55_9GAST|nr:hypothetical protein RRG08_041018 [Elysia crispata]
MFSRLVRQRLMSARAPGSCGTKYDESALCHSPGERITNMRLQERYACLEAGSAAALQGPEFRHQINLTRHDWRGEKLSSVLAATSRYVVSVLCEIVITSTDLSIFKIFSYACRSNCTSSPEEEKAQKKHPHNQIWRSWPKQG